SLARSYRFFLQAEDGIRDFHVTGVQTCALPIFQPGLDPATVTRDGETWVVPLKRITEDFIGEAVPQEDSFSGILVSRKDGLATRSEERRVGKECSAQRSTSDEQVTQGATGAIPR